ncbi:hypothetical protein IAR55_003446 [Kwoniella newhampshirensis]|uniref:YTH domain-containing protein n=1 Tax=Kwoniella newhampshirensis TaxID=1651941 RepID=A0AAW0YYN8_9TREE
MSSAPIVPIRQPRGPTSNSFGAPSNSNNGIVSPSNGPPAPDTESLLRRHNTVSTTRHHQPSASISANPAASSAFHGSASARLRSGGAGAGGSASTGFGGPGGGSGFSRFRSGSLSSSSGPPDVGLVRRGSGRETVRPEKAVPEGGETEEIAMETGSWGKGLARQSSLPSRRMINPVTAIQPEVPKHPAGITSNAPGSMGPPPRPPRRLSVVTQDNSTGPSTQSPSHSVSHSLSSLALFNRPPSYTTDADDQTYIGGNVSRTQSLRAQAKNADTAGLGRSTSLKASGEHYRPIQALSPPSHPTTPHHLFTPPTPPPVSSTAALPPFQLPISDSQSAHNDIGADLKRHQSLTQGYGTSNRVRDRLERSPAVLNMEQREEVRRRTDVRPDAKEEEPPTSPIGPSLWSNSVRPDDGWSRSASQQLQDAFDAMNLGRKMMGSENGLTSGGVGALTLESNVMRQAQPATSAPSARMLGHTGEEPSWVTSLVGADYTPQMTPRLAGPGSTDWQDRDIALRQHQQQQQQHQQQQQQQQQQMAFAQQQMHQQQQRWPDQMLQGQRLSFLQQQQMLAAGAYNAMKNGNAPQGYPPPHLQPDFLGTPFGASPYPSPPGTAVMQQNQDRDVIELARSKGLNPATYDCRPTAARFFVIKSYTEEDVQKSLKHEIWSSTVLGNKRLDAAFRESAEQCPIYLFFSVNGSRHFCGVAQMLTPVDENTTSKVWAQDKWKGIFKVKWIFVRDVPSQALRHIRLTNTPEQKPITNSRDTQELPYEAGCEVLQIFLDHQTKSKTSLLQDFAYYERLSANRNVHGQTPGQSPTPILNSGIMPQGLSPQLQMQMQIQMQSPPLPPIMSMGPPPSPAHMVGNGVGMGMAGVPPVPQIPARFR